VQHTTFTAISTPSVPTSDTSEISNAVKQKSRELRDMMRAMGNVLVAYSGGVDSSYLAYVANQVLYDRALCVLGRSPSVSQHQLNEAFRTAEEICLKLEIIDTDEFENEAYAANPTNRCYFCKSELYEKLSALARKREIAFVIDGTNADDVVDIRPGRLAASENAVRSPLAEVGLTKQEIRQLSRAAGLSGWEKPASPCLASRIAYGVPVTIERLSRVEAGEEYLRGLGFREFRVRVHGDLARIEIAPAELEKALDRDFADLTVKRFTEIGFKYVTLDLKGFRSGSLNNL